MCGTFVRGTAQAPNWLPDSWTAVVKTPLLQKAFLQSKNCSSGNSALCCQELGFTYTPNPIGSKTLSAERSAAEFLSRKKIIESQSLTPTSYRLSESLSRKEFMKILMNLSGKPLSTECQEVFADVANDWACKYIETALEQGYIT